MNNRQNTSRRREVKPVDRIQEVLNFCSSIIREEGGSTVYNSPENISQALANASGRLAPVTDEEIEKAANLLFQIINSQSPSQVVSDHLSDIEQLLPALIELNIQEAQKNGNQDLLVNLRALQTSLRIQGTSLGQNHQAVDVIAEEEKSSGKRHPPRVLISKPKEGVRDSRASMIYQILQCADCEILDSNSAAAKNLDFDVLITCNPFCEPAMMRLMAACSAANIPIIFDIDNDYEETPLSDPAYLQLSLNTPENARAYASALMLATAISVPTNYLAATLRQKVGNIWILPDGWSDRNVLWTHPIPKHNMTNIGWAGSLGRIEDLLPIRRMLIRTIREFSQTQLIIYGNSQVYQLFESLPESRKIFVPETAPDDYPYVLDQIDILTVPLVNTPYNLYKSDKPLVEAGVKYTPWIASPIPSFIEWEKGGLIANSLDEWHTYMRQLLIDSDLRVSLGIAGNRKATERRISQLAEKWMELIDNVLTLAGKPIQIKQEQMV